MKSRWSVLVCFVVVIGLGLAPLNVSGASTASLQDASTPVLNAQLPTLPQAPQDIPDTVVASGVTDYTLAGVKLFWHTGPAPCPPATPDGADAASHAPTDAFVDIISRVASRGSLTRQLYFQQLFCRGLAGQIESNVVADDNYVYFTKADGLYQLSVNANVGDAPQLMNALVAGYAELAIDDTSVFALTSPSTSSGGPVYSIRKDNHQRVFLTNSGAYASDLQVSYSYSFIDQTARYYLYWLRNGNLKRFNLNTAMLDTP